MRPAPAEEESYVMPNFVGQHLADASAAISEVGLRIGKIEGLDSTALDKHPSSGLVVARQLHTRFRPRALHVVLKADPAALRGEAAENLRMLSACGCPWSL